MHIAIDGRTIVRNRTGVGVYAERLVRSLLKIDQKNNYTLFLVEDDPSLTAPKLKKVLIPGYQKMGPNRLWENVLLPRYLRKENVRVYFSPAYVLPLMGTSRIIGLRSTGTRLVVTLHDLVAYSHPETFTLKMRLWQKLYVNNAVRYADCVLADSAATKRDIHNLFNVADERIRVVHLPVGDQFHPIQDHAVLESTRKLYGLPDKFILYVGTLEPRKNVGRLAEAYSLLPESLRAGYSLLLAGGLGWYSEGIRRDIERLGLGDKIRLLGYIDQKTLPALYTLASVFAYLSLYEGFGAPPLEAMACGTPVLVSNASALPEAVGDAAVLVDPYDVKEIAVQLEGLLTDEVRRKTLSQAGFERAALFGTREKAEEVLRIFEEIGARKSP